MCAYSLVGRLVNEHGAHKEHRVEPQTDLLLHLKNVLCGEVLLPVFLVGEVLESRERNDTCIKPYVADLSYSLNCLLTLGTADLYLVYPRAVEMRNSIDLRLVNCKLVKLVLRANYRQLAALAEIERQRQTVESLTGDVPVGHILKPVEHSLTLICRLPTNLVSVRDKSGAKLVNGYCPLLAETEDYLLLTSPANRVAVLILMCVEELISLLELVEYELAAILSVKSGKEGEAVIENAVFVNGDYLGKTDRLAECKVLCTASGSDVNDSASLVVSNLVPENDLVSEVLLVYLGEAGLVLESLKVSTLESCEKLNALLALKLLLEVVERGNVVVLLTCNVKSYVGHLGIYRESNVCRESPGSSCPYENVIVRILDRKLEEYSLVLDLLIRACHLVLGERCSATRAPGHRLIYLTDPAALVALL